MRVMSVLHSWSLIARNNAIKCNKGHFLELCPSTAYWTVSFGDANKRISTAAKRKLSAIFTNQSKNALFFQSPTCLYIIL